MASTSNQTAGERDKEKNVSNDDEPGYSAIAPKLSSTPSGFGATHSTYCIFKIPECLTHDNHNAYGYQPAIVSIGPYHHGKQQLSLIEGQKEKFLSLFLSKAGNGVSPEKLVDAVARRKYDIKQSYLDLSGVGDTGNKEKEKVDKLIQMMVLDGCFLLTLFLTAAGNLRMVNPIFSMPWALPSIRRDLLLLENQIPLFVLETLLNAAKFTWKTDLNKIALDFFSSSFRKPKDSWASKHCSLKAKHLLDLIRQTFIPTTPQTDNASIPLQTSLSPPQTNNNASEMESGTSSSSEPLVLKLTLSAKKLCNSGVKFELKKGVDTFLDIGFKNGVLQIPEIILDDFLRVVLLNFIAFEQFYAKPLTDVTSYTMLMGCLVNSERDAAYLIEKGIIQNYLGTEDEVSRFFKRILNDYVFDIETSYLASVFNEVNEYSSNGLHVEWARFKQTYMGSLWIALSSIAALTLLLLTITQVVLAAIAL